MLRTSMIALLFLLTACSAERSDPALERGNTLTALYSGSNEWLFSPNHDDSPKFLMFEPLVTRASTQCSEIVGGLARSWEVNENYTEWTVELRPDVLWHDGVPVTAHDAATSLEVWQDPEVGWYGGAPVAEWNVIDSLTLGVRLHERGDWPRDTWDVIHPGHIIEDLDRAAFFEWDFWTQPIGNGPFRFVRAEPETFVEVAANEDYYLGRPSIDRLIIQFQSGSGSGMMELRAGNVDMAHLPPLEASTLAEDVRFNVYYLAQASALWLVWNTTHPVLAELPVRRALAHASDRRTLASVVGLPEELPITDAPAGPCGLDGGELVDPYSFDLAEARSLLTESGWVDRDGDGIREKDGRALAFSLIVHQRAEDLAVFLQDQWRAIGVEAQIRTLESTVVHGLYREGDFEAIIPQTGHAGVQAAVRDGPLPVLDEQLAQLMSRSRTEPDIDRARRMARQAAERYRELAPTLFLHYKVSALVAHRRVKGLGQPGSILPTLGYRHPFGDLTKVWIDQGVAGSIE